MGQKSDTSLVFEFPLIARCIIFVIFVCSRTIFIKRRRSSSADVNKLCFYANKL